MKQISKESAARMCAALEYALDRVRDGTCMGICSGVERAHVNGIMDAVERNYLTRWICKMLTPNTWLEDYMKTEVPAHPFHQRLRYERRKPWVEWMINHLKETT